MVHVEPRAPSNEHLFETIRAIAQRRGMAVHELSAHHLDGRLFVELHLEVDEEASLREAHRRATELEQDILQETDPHALVNIHIEPLGGRIPGAEEMSGLSRAVQEFLNSLPNEYHELTNCHEVRVRTVDHKILVSCHCAMEGNLPITRVHDITAAAGRSREGTLPADFPADNSSRAARKKADTGRHEWPRTATKVGSPVVDDVEVTARTHCKRRKAMRHPPGAHDGHSVVRCAHSG